MTSPLDLIAENLGEKYPQLDVVLLKRRWAEAEGDDLLTLSDILHEIYPESK